MYRPAPSPDTLRGGLVCLVTVTCLVVYGVDVATAQYYDEDVWVCTDNDIEPKSQYMASYGVDYSVNMNRLSAGKTCSLYVYSHNEDDARHVTLNITTLPGSHDHATEPCLPSLPSNSLMLKKHEAPSIQLMCGNEITQWMEVGLPFSLVFTKGSGSSQSQLNQFVILINMESSAYSIPSLKVTPEPRLLYSPLYPLDYPENSRVNIQLQVDTDSAVFFQLRYMNLEATGTQCRDSLSISARSDLTQEELCRNDSLSTVILPRNYAEGVKVSFKSDGSISGGGFELEYRAVRINPTMNCVGLNKTFIVSEANFVSVRLEIGPRSSTTCELRFSGVSDDDLIVMTNVTSGDVWRRLCVGWYVDILVGNKVLPQNGCKHSAFGLLRSVPGQDVRILLTSKQYNTAVNSMDIYRKEVEIGFVVESKKTENLPSGVNAHTSPSYIWIPSTKQSSVYTGDNAALEVRAAQASCVEFSALSKNWKLKPKLSSLMSLYSGGYDVSDHFELTKDCRGNVRNDSVVSSGYYRLTNAVIKNPRSSGFWFTFTQTDNKPCPILPTHLTITSQQRDNYLFKGVEFKQHMHCLFILPPNMATPFVSTRFKGSLDHHHGAELFVTEGAKTPHTMVDFTRTDSQDWFYSRNILYVYFKTGVDINDHMASFVYGDRYTSGDTTHQIYPACPGPHTVYLSDTTDFYTPDYPNHLETNTSCVWKFTRPSHYGTDSKKEYIHISIEKLDLPCDSSTRLFIQGEENNVIDVKPVCGTAPFFRVFPGNAQIRLQGGPDHVVKGIHFKVFLQTLDYHTVCNKSYNIDSQSRGLDVTGTLNNGHYLLPFHCWMKLYASSSDERMHVRLNSVKIEGSVYSYFECAENKLTIYDGSRRTDRQLIETCHSSGESVVSSSNSILIEILVQTPQESPVAFNLSIQRAGITNCNGRVMNLVADYDDEYLYSPGYPTSYYSKSDCRWLIMSGTPYEVEIEIMDLVLESSRNCRFDSLEIFDGSSSTNTQSLAIFCGRVTSTHKFRSSSGSLYLRFKTDAELNARGFKIRYYSQRTPSPDLDSGSDRPVTSGDDDDDDNTIANKTGVIIGACLSAILGVFGVGFACVWLVHKKRIRDQRHRQRRRRDAARAQLNRTNQESSVYVINPLIVNNAAPPPPYPGLVNQGFVEEPPPSYHDALNHLVPSSTTTTTRTTPSSSTTATSMASRQPPPPPYSLSTPRGHEAITEEEESPYNQTGPLYDNLSSSAIYETLRSHRRNSSATTDTTAGAPASPAGRSNSIPHQEQQQPADENNGSHQPVSHYSLPQGEDEDDDKDNEGGEGIRMRGGGGRDYDNVNSSSSNLDTTASSSDYNLPEGEAETDLSVSVDAEQNSNRSIYSLAREPRRNNRNRHQSDSTTSSSNSRSGTTSPPPHPPPPSSSSTHPPPDYNYSLASNDNNNGVEYSLAQEGNTANDNRRNHNYSNTNRAERSLSPHNRIHGAGANRGLAQNQNRPEAESSRRVRTRGGDGGGRGRMHSNAEQPPAYERRDPTPRERRNSLGPV